MDISTTEAQIKDKSKADRFSKVITIVQTSWFFIQCIARGAQGIALVHLELVTLAVIVLNMFTFFFWLDKPFGVQVQEEVKIYLKTESNFILDEEEGVSLLSQICDYD